MTFIYRHLQENQNSIMPILRAEVYDRLEHMYQYLLGIQEKH